MTALEAWITLIGYSLALGAEGVAMGVLAWSLWQTRGAERKR